MKLKQRRRGVAALQRRSPGQSIVLIALVLAILVGLVALSVDVGNAYAEQRAAQRASNAAAVEGMRVITSGGTNSDAYNAIKATLEAHKIKVVDGGNGAVAAPGERVLNAYYVFGDGRTERIPMASDAIPSNVQYIRVDLSGSQATNFAGVVGQGSLPIKADAYASFDVCPPYPIAVAQDAFSNPTFPNAPGDGYYSDENYQRKPMRRMYLRDDANATLANQTIKTGADPKGQFVWLRWRDTSTVDKALEEIYKGLIDPSQATNGIEEVLERVPVETFDKTPDDDAYPTKRGNPSEWDLIRGGPYVRFGTAYSIPNLPNMGGKNDPTGGQKAIEAKITQQLQWLIDNRTLMNLVEYDRATPNAIRQGANIRIAGFGGYMMVSYGYEERDSSSSGNRGSGWFIDLVKVGPPLKCVTNEGEVFFDEGDKVTLQGNVYIRPELSSKLDEHAPLDIVIVLDASGSMNWTWEGYGMWGSPINTPDNEAILLAKHGKVPKVGDPVDCIALLSSTLPCQSANAYEDATQRRLYIAKQAIKGFIEQFPWQETDRLALVTYRGAGNPDTLATVYPSSGLTKDIPGVANALMNQAATYNGDIYKTIGASPGALGLRKAQQVLEAGGDPSRNRFVIFFSDGLLNVNLEGVNTGIETIDANWDPLRIKSHYPINQAVEVAEQMRSTENNSFPTIIYTVALGNTYDISGLPLTATEANAPYFNIASDPGALATLLENIGNRIKHEGCNPTTLIPQAPELGTMYRMRPDGTFVVATGEDGTPSLGTVTIRDTAGNFVAKADIGANGFFSVKGLAPNTNYILSFNNVSDDPVFYMGYDGKYRNYSRIADPNGETEIMIRTQTTGINNIITLNDGVPLVLYLTGKNVCQGLEGNTGSNP